MSSVYYSPSGIFPLRVVAFALLSILFIIPISWIYALLILKVPLILLNFFSVAGFSFVLVVTGITVTNMGHARSPLLMGLTGMLIGLLAWYCEWVFWLDLLVHDSHYGFQVDELREVRALQLASNPLLMWRIAQIVNDVGVWSLKDTVVSGIPLTIIWVGEFFVITLPITYYSYLQAGVPYCEQNKSRAKETELGHCFPFVENIRDFVRVAETNPNAIKNLLESLGVAHTGLERFAIVKVFICDNEINGFMSVSNREITVDKNNNKNIKEKQVIRYLRVSRSVLKELLNM